MPQFACQPLAYLQFTLQTFQDLALEEMKVFTTAFMQRVATSMTELVREDGYQEFAPDICGGTFQRGLYSKASEPGIAFHCFNAPFAPVGKWNTTGMIEQAVRDAYGGIDFND